MTSHLAEFSKVYFSPSQQKLDKAIYLKVVTARLTPSFGFIAQAGVATLLLVILARGWINAGRFCWYKRVVKALSKH